jgi:hypothetical protein
MICGALLRMVYYTYDVLLSMGDIDMLPAVRAGTGDNALSEGNRKSYVPAVLTMPYAPCYSEVKVDSSLLN